MPCPFLIARCPRHRQPLPLQVKELGEMLLQLAWLKPQTVSCEQALLKAGPFFALLTISRVFDVTYYRRGNYYHESEEECGSFL